MTCSMKYRKCEIINSPKRYETYTYSKKLLVLKTKMYVLKNNRLLKNIVFGDSADYIINFKNNRFLKKLRNTYRALEKYENNKYDNYAG